MIGPGPACYNPDGMVPWLAVFLLGVFMGHAGARPKVFVFFPSLARPLAIQEALAGKCPGLDVTVFGRLTDLRAMAAREPPLAILAPLPALGQFGGYRPRLQGIRNGSATEKYVLLSIGKPFAPGADLGSSIGAVGIFDRAGMSAFAKGIVPGSPRINLVTKVEDLLPVLIFGSADAILISETNMREFRKKSRANLVSTELKNAQVGLLAVGMRAAAPLAGAGAEAARGEKDILAALKALDAGTLALLGVDAWQ